MKQDKIPSQQVISTTPFPNSKKVYVKGEKHDIQVAMREISLSPTKINGKSVENKPITVYDTSGPYTDPNVQIDVRKGLPRLREQWIMERGDIERLFEFSSEYGTQRMNDTSLDQLRFEHIKMPLRAKEGRNVTQLHYAKMGIVTPEMEYIAIRENQRSAEDNASLNW